MEKDVRFIVNAKYKIDEETVRILEEMAKTSGVERPVVALPDLHHKLSYHTPTGVVVLTKDKIVPKFVNPNCGMSFIITPFYAVNFTQEKLDRVFNYIKDHISVATRMEPIISEEDLKDIVKNGAAWSFNKFGLDKNDLLNFENNGSLFFDEDITAEEIFSHIPEVCRKMGLRSMGVLGFGNHFIEMQEAEDIINADIAKSFGISRGQICFMIHGDSRAFGRSLFDFCSNKAKSFLGLREVYKKIHYTILTSKMFPMWIKNLIEDINYYGNRVKHVLYRNNHNKEKVLKFQSIDADSAEGESFRISTYAALNYAYANRAYIAGIIGSALREVFPMERCDIKILCDGSHDSLQKESIGGEKFWVHRNGAARAYPGAFYKNHPFFGVTGQPVILPSSLANPSFLCAADQASKLSWYSSSHGTGRIVDRHQARHKFSARQVLKTCSEKGLKVYDYGKGLISEESPEAFKDIQDIIETIETNGIAKRVVKLKPLAVLKGWL